MKITLLRTWEVNIGNGFIDKGAKMAIQRSFPDADIVEVSGYPNLAASRRDAGLLPDVPVFDSLPSYGTRWGDGSNLSNVVNVAEFVDSDLAVLPGCILYDHVLERYAPVFESLKERDIPIILLGAGGLDYSSQTKKYVREFIDAIDPAGIITRDSNAYEAYKNDVEHAYDGIDCAFYIDEWYQPPEANEELVVSTFDKGDEPAIATDKRIIRADHHPLCQPNADLRSQYKKYTEKTEFFQEENVMVSDLLEDYLFFYANATQTHSDRIHACVPTLAYGNAAQFWFETPRGALFDRVTTDDITQKATTLDQDTLEEEKTRQAETLRQMAKDAL